MNNNLDENVQNYLYNIRPIFKNDYELESAKKQVMNKLDKNKNYFNQIKLGDDIINIFVSGQVKVQYSDDFRYAYIYVADRVKDIYSKTNQYDKTDIDAEILSFKIIITAIINNYNLRDFNTFALDGFIDEYANMDIIRQNSILKQNQMFENEIRRENLRKNIELREKLPREVVKFVITMGMIISLIIAGNIVVNTFRTIINKLASKRVEPSKLSELKTVENSLNELGYYNYENNEFIRS